MTIERPTVFPAEQSEEARFWGWLSDAFALKASELNSDKNLSPDQIIILTRPELKRMIAESIDKKEQDRTEQLLELASTRQNMSEEMVRKSVRVGAGEYLTLYSLKLRQESSFADIIVQILTPKIVDFLNTMSRKVEGEQVEKERLLHLLKQVKTWPDNKPKSRVKFSPAGKSADWDEDMPIMAVNYPKQPWQIEKSFVDFVISEFNDRLEQIQFSHRSEIREVQKYFEDYWRRTIGESIPNSIVLEPKLDQNTTKSIKFVPSISPFLWIREKELEELFDRYGEQEVRLFADAVDFVSQVPEEHRQTDHDLSEVRIGLDLKLPAFSAKVKDINEIEVVCVEEEIFSKKGWRYGNELWSIIERVAPRAEQNPRQLFKIEHDIYLDEKKRLERTIGQIVASSENLTRFIKLATKLAESPDDFKDIRDINLLRNRIQGYEDVKYFLEDVIKTSLKRHSVMSFYVNDDVWRVVPIILKKTNWIELTDMSRVSC